jgi:hypothetical protein
VQVVARRRLPVKVLKRLRHLMRPLLPRQKKKLANKLRPLEINMDPVLCAGFFFLDIGGRFFS